MGSSSWRCELCNYAHIIPSDYESNETNAEYARLAEAYGMDADKIKEMIAVEDLAADIKVKKAVELLRAEATIKEVAPAKKAPAKKKTTRKKTAKKADDAEAKPEKKTTKKTTKKADAEEKPAKKPAAKKTTKKAEKTEE